MAFRADEAARVGYEYIEHYLIPRPRDADESQREQSKKALLDILDECGPVVDSYPTWHPLVRNHDSSRVITTPSEQCGYKGLDHTIYFVNGFITCPYDDGQKVIDSVDALPGELYSIATITAERLDVKLYNSNCTPILVRCHWEKPLLMDRTIPLSIAMPLILEKELQCWRWSQLAETWESMRPNFLGTPHGSRSSLFINQETGLAIKKIWNALIDTGMYGPIKI
jgi:hypothetical protein